MRAILTYHSIDSSGSPISVDEDVFRRHMDWLAARQINVLPLTEIQSTSDVGDAVALTFDDGFRNFEDAAHPILREKGFPATVFVVTGHVGGDNRWGGAEQPGIPTLPLLDWDQLSSLAERGVSLGAHTVHHPRLTELSVDDIEGELGDSKETIRARTGLSPDTLAYPYGDHDSRVVGVAERHFRVACTTRLDTVSPREAPARLPRLDMFYFRSPGRLETWGSPGFSRYVRARRMLRGLRALLTPGT